MKNHLNYRFFKLKEKPFVSIHSIYCEIELGSVKSFGRGDSFNEKEARYKAFGEAIERVVLKPSSPGFEELGCPSNSNGLAFHYALEDSQEGALKELIERQAVLSAWAGMQEVLIFEDLSLFLEEEKRNDFEEVISSKKDLSPKVLYFGDICDLSVVGVALQSKNPPYFVFGYSASKSIREATEKALLEAVILNIGYLPLIKNVPEEKKERILKNKFVENVRYYAENQLDLIQIFPKSEEVSELTRFIPARYSDQFEFKVFFLQNLGMPGVVSRCTHPNFFNFRAGVIREPMGCRQKGEVHPVG